MERKHLTSASQLDFESAPHSVPPAEQQAGPGIRLVIALIMFNNGSRSGTAGIRGASPGPVRQFILRDDDYDIHIKIWGDANHRQIRGQLLPRSGKGFPSFARCYLLHNGARIQSTIADDTGEFHFDDVPDSDLYLQVDLNGLTIVGSLNFQN